MIYAHFILKGDIFYNYSLQIIIPPEMGGWKSKPLAIVNHSIVHPQLPPLPYTRYCVYWKETSVILNWISPLIKQSVGDDENLD